jgi:hypothetical protein
MSKAKPKEENAVRIEDFHQYHGGGQTFPVMSADLVFVIESQTKKPKPTGYNHARAWHAALKAATT